MIDVEKYLGGDIQTIIDYRRFAKDNDVEEAKVLWNIEKFIANQVKDILLIAINEDNLFLTKKELEKVHPEIRNYLRFSERRGIKIYVFTTKDGGFKKAVGVFGWSTGRTNEYFFDKIIADEKYQDITTTVSVKLTDLFTQK